MSRIYGGDPNELLRASIQIGSQDYDDDGILRPAWSDAAEPFNGIVKYQGAYSVDQNVVLMVHPVGNPDGVYYPLKVQAGEYSAPFIFDYIFETGTTGTLTDVYVFPC